MLHSVSVSYDWLVRSFTVITLLDASDAQAICLAKKLIAAVAFQRGSMPLLDFSVSVDFQVVSMFFPHQSNTFYVVCLWEHVKGLDKKNFIFLI